MEVEARQVMKPRIPYALFLGRGSSLGRIPGFDECTT